MENYLIISIIVNIITFVLLICAVSAATFLLGNTKSLGKTVRLLLRDKNKLQSRLDLINNKLASRAGLPLKEPEKKTDATASPVRKIVSASESIARLEKSQSPPPAPFRKRFWTEGEQ